MDRVPKLIMTVGLPGSGKSTWARKYADDHQNFAVVSSDKIRKEMFGDESSQANNAAVFQELHKRVKDHLKAETNVIYDATNINAKKRMNFLRELNGIECKKIARVFTVPFAKCLERNWSRERVVPFEAMDRMYRSWQTPWYFEGWDDIEVQYNASYDIYDVNLYVDYDQNNPHHKYTLGTHMIKANEYLTRLINESEDDLIYEHVPYRAALLHDCGKPYCRSTDENGVSHYYGHASVGGYDALCRYGELLFTSVLICYHMHPMQWMSAEDPDRIYKKYRKLWGSDLFNCVMLLHEVDVMAGK